MNQFEKLEEKLDANTNALVKLSESMAVFTEKMIQIGDKLKAFEERIRTLEEFRNKGLGAMVVISVIGAGVWFLVKALFTVSK